MKKTYKKIYLSLVSFIFISFFVCISYYFLATNWFFLFILDGSSGLYEQQLVHLKQLCNNKKLLSYSHQYYVWFIDKSKDTLFDMKECKIEELYKSDFTKNTKNKLNNNFDILKYEKVFIWLKSKIKTQKIALFFSGHGWPWNEGFEKVKTAINADDLIKTWGKIFENKKINYLLFDACLTGNIETLVTLSTYVESVTVQHQTINSSGINFQILLDKLSRKLFISETDIANNVTSSYRDEYNEMVYPISVASYHSLENFNKYFELLNQQTKNLFKPKIPREHYVMGWHELSETFLDFSYFIEQTSNKILIKNYQTLLSKSLIDIFIKNTNIKGPTIYYPINEIKEQKIKYLNTIFAKDYNYKDWIKFVIEKN
ncbi:MAG: hypothetical protein HQK51_06540 [Oligoflexia bacterium]|nr:hypothetical protein [Oligoflexia bacterium]